MAKFRVNTDTLQETIDTYQTVISDIEQAIKDAQEAIDVLKNSGWKSNASKAFFENFDSSWKTNVNNRVKVIKHLKSCLQDAKTDYEELCSEASRLGNSI
jgi:WXG100 family type VII secretion target